MIVDSSPRTALSGAGYSSGLEIRFKAECTKRFILFDELIAQTRIVKIVEKIFSLRNNDGGNQKIIK